jgi:hypothetical protein
VKTTRLDENPPEPRYRVDQRDRIFIGDGALPVGDFVIGWQHGVSQIVDVEPGTPLDRIIAYQLIHFHDDPVSRDAHDLVFWRKGKLVALFRALPDGRREVLVFQGRKVERRVFPPSKLWLDYLEPQTTTPLD